MDTLAHADLMRLHAAATDALHDDEDPIPALDAFAAAFLAAFPAGTPRPHLAYTYASSLVACAAASPIPGVLAHLVASGLLLHPTDADGTAQPQGSFLTGQALRRLHAQQAHALADLAAYEMGLLRDTPTGPLADDWFLFATALPLFNDLSMSFGLSHNQKPNMDPAVDGPFTVYPKPRDALDRARAAAKALAQRVAQPGPLLSTPTWNDDL